MNKATHLFHLVSPSPWPFLSASMCLLLTTGGVMYFHYDAGGWICSFAGCSLLYAMGVLWWRDVVREGTFRGYHTSLVVRGLRIGMVLFIVSEVMFFAAFFWGFFHSSLGPTVEINAVWPPLGIDVISPWGVPLVNTLILLTSGAGVTWCHHGLLFGLRTQSRIALWVTVILAMMFTGLQAYEYVDAGFGLSSGVYGSTFYMATGFHGFHVLIGTIFLFVSLLRMQWFQLTPGHHIGLECACWYWHFVDVVWLALFISVYWWGGA